MSSEERLVTVQYPEERLPQRRPRAIFRFSSMTARIRQKGLALCRLPDLREGMPAPVHLHRQGARTRSRITSGKLQFQPKVFDIDISVCMSCQICVEVCPFDAIKMDTEFELSTGDRFGQLLLHKQQLAKANHYYHKIHPSEAAEVDARLGAEKAKAEAKARGSDGE